MFDVDAAEKRVAASEEEGVVMNGDGLRAIFKKVDTVFGEVLFDERGRFADVVVSVDGESTGARADFCEDGREVFDGAWATVDKVAGEGDDVCIEMGCGLCGEG